MNEKKQKINEFNILGVNVQLLITIGVIVFALIYLFTEKFLFVLEILMGIDLLVMSYNNHKIYHKRKLTIIYMIFAIVLFIFAILSILGVI